MLSCVYSKLFCRPTISLTPKRILLPFGNNGTIRVHCNARCSERSASEPAVLFMAAAPEVGPRVPSRSLSEGAVLASKVERRRGRPPTANSLAH